MTLRGDGKPVSAGTCGRCPARRAYDRYVAHVRREHADQPVMSRREFERQRQDARESHPRARCC